MSIVDEFAAGNHFHHPIDGTAFLAYRHVHIRQPTRVEQIRRERQVPALLRIPLHSGIGEQPPHRRHSLPIIQSDDDDVDVRHAPRVRTPRERPVSEGDLEPAPAEQDRPELRHLLTLGDRVGRHEADPRAFAGRAAALDVPTRRDELGGHIVERPAAPAERGDPAHLRPLFG